MGGKNGNWDQRHSVVPAWRNSPGACAWSDSERHLGHIVNVGQDWWAAFDGTHATADFTAFRPLGLFRSVRAAKLAVESATTPSTCPPAECPETVLV
jgi:hypothetical protein